MDIKLLGLTLLLKSDHCKMLPVSSPQPRDSRYTWSAVCTKSHMLTPHNLDLCRSLFCLNDISKIPVSEINDVKDCVIRQ